MLYFTELQFKGLKGEMGTYPAVPDEQIDQFGLEPPNSSDTA